MRCTTARSLQVTSAIPNRRAQRRRLPGFVAVAAAAASVAAIAAVLVAVTWKDDGGGGGGGGVPAAGGGFAEVLGYQWRVTGLVDTDGELSVPNAHGAMIGFTQHGDVVGNDSVNSVGAHYEAAVGGYSVRGAAMTLVGYAGDDPDRMRLIAAVNAMFLNESAPQRPNVVSVTVDGDTLTLVSGSVTLTLARGGEQPELSTEAPASATANR